MRSQGTNHDGAIHPDECLKQIVRQCAIIMKLDTDNLKVEPFDRGRAVDTQNR